MVMLYSCNIITPIKERGMTKIIENNIAKPMNCPQAAGYSAVVGLGLGEYISTVTTMGATLGVFKGVNAIVPQSVIHLSNRVSAAISTAMGNDIETMLMPPIKTLIGGLLGGVEGAAVTGGLSYGICEIGNLEQTPVSRGRGRAKYISTP